MTLSLCRRRHCGFFLAFLFFLRDPKWNPEKVVGPHAKKGGEHTLIKEVSAGFLFFAFEGNVIEPRKTATRKPFLHFCFSNNIFSVFQYNTKN